MNLIRLEQQLMRDEGFRAEPYRCSAGKWTIGFGARRLCCQAVTEDTPAIGRDLAQQQLRADIFKATLDMRELFPRWHKMNDLRQEVLVNMAFNLGFTGLARFKRLRAAASQLHYFAMAREMRDSLWYEQVGQRAQRLVIQMHNG